MIAGLVSLGYLLGNALIQIKEYERSVNVKGLSEREYPADVVIWPIVFAEASNDLEQLYNSIEDSSGKIRQFLLDSGLEASEVSVSLPAITDKSAREYDSGARAEFRFTANQTVTIYSSRRPPVRHVRWRKNLQKIHRASWAKSSARHRDSSVSRQEIPTILTS